jgi:hypothetical protein
VSSFLCLILFIFCYFLGIEVSPPLISQESTSMIFLLVLLLVMSALFRLLWNLMLTFVPPTVTPCLAVSSCGREPCLFCYHSSRYIISLHIPFMFYDIFVEKFLVVSSFPVPALYSFGSTFPLCLLCVSCWFSHCLEDKETS